MIYAMVIGEVGLFCLFEQGWIILRNQKDAIPAPSDPGSDDFFVRYSWGIQRIFSGDTENMMPTSISQIIEQVFNAAVSLLAAWDLSPTSSDGTENSIAKMGAAGSMQ